MSVRVRFPGDVQDEITCQRYETHHAAGPVGSDVAGHGHIALCDHDDVAARLDSA